MGSEENSETKGETETAKASTDISAEVLKRVEENSKKAVAEAVKAATEAASKAIKDERARIKQAVDGGEPVRDDRQARVLEHLLTDPVGTLARVAEETRKATIREIEERDAAADERFAEERAAAAKVLAARIDIRTNQEASKRVGVIYERDTDKNLPAEERVRQAVDLFDKEVEALGLPSKEQRIALATAAASNGNRSAEPAEKPVSYTEQYRASLVTEKDERHANWSKKHGGLKPPTKIKGL